MPEPQKCPVCNEELIPHYATLEPSCFVHGDYRLENGQWVWYPLNERY